MAAKGWARRLESPNLRRLHTTRLAAIWRRSMVGGSPPCMEASHA